MWIVRLALRRPYTFVVLALVVVVLGGVTMVRMPTDIFPDINIPVVSVIWQYGGMGPDDMANRVVTFSERGATTTVNDIEHIESQSLNGFGAIKLFFHPGAKPEAAVAQLTALSGGIVRVMPPGIVPPSIIQYSASHVPILQLVVSSDKLSEAELFDYGMNFVRNQLATIQGAALPIPYGGKPRQIMVDLDPSALFGKGLSPVDVSNALNAQNLILPAGTAKIGDREYNVRLNSSPEAVAALNDLPIRESNGAIVYMRDVAQVHDGFAVQTNLVRRNGERSALLTVLKSGAASTLDIVSRVRAALPRVLATLPPELQITPLFDQSLFVRAALNGVVREAGLAAVLTALMILLFLGSWRSTVIVAISIPLSILCSIIVLAALGQTLNVMTLGGLALAVGILVDDATVEIENIHRNLAQGKPLVKAILDGAQQIAVPAFVSTLAICIVFVPVVFLTGAAQSLFTPLAMAVVFAMLASYLLSRTLVPTLVQYLLRSEAHGEAVTPRRFDRLFDAFRDRYVAALQWTLAHRAMVLLAFGVFLVASAALGPMIGQDFFPRVDAGQFRLHVRAAPGTRLEETERVFEAVEGAIRERVGGASILDNIGLPFIGVNLAYSDNATIGSSDGEILVSLGEGQKGRTWDIVRDLRRELPVRFPGVTFFFQPSDIVNQILNFGLPSPIDVQIVGRNLEVNYTLARELEGQIARIPGAADVHLHQVMDVPELRVNVDRTRAQELGLTQRDVANSLLVSLSSSSQVAPNFWLNPANGVSYAVAVQTPQSRIDSIETLLHTPILAPGRRDPQLLTNLATVERKTGMSVVSHYNVQPVVDVYANVQDRDLGGVARDIDRLLAPMQAKLPHGSSIVMRGQVDSMRSSFVGLGFGLIFAMLLVYFLMVINFQSWLDPVIIMTALPGALAGIIWTLFVTRTTISVPSLMGAIMSIGVATANSILLVTFANEERLHGRNATEAALSAGFTRLRPVLMTALAMVIGMMPMALAFGEGAEQNAPLGRAVVGGLVVATAATLFVVPVVYSLLRKQPPHGAALAVELEHESE